MAEECNLYLLVADGNDCEICCSKQHSSSQAFHGNPDTEIYPPVHSILDSIWIVPTTRCLEFRVIHTSKIDQNWYRDLSRCV